MLNLGYHETKSIQLSACIDPEILTERKTLKR